MVDAENENGARAASSAMATTMLIAHRLPPLTSHFCSVHPPLFLNLSIHIWTNLVLHYGNCKLKTISEQNRRGPHLFKAYFMTNCVYWYELVQTSAKSICLLVRSGSDCLIVGLDCNPILKIKLFKQ
jgi:hypothetical protein